MATETIICSVFYEWDGRREVVRVPFNSYTLILCFKLELRQILLKDRGLPAFVKLYIPGPDFNNDDPLPQSLESFTLVPPLGEIQYFVNQQSASLYAEILLDVELSLSMCADPVITVNAESTGFNAQDLVDNHISFECTAQCPAKVQAIKSQAEALRGVTRKAS